jgi:hypothetical protein
MLNSGYDTIGLSKDLSTSRKVLCIFMALVPPIVCSRKVRRISEFRGASQSLSPIVLTVGEYSKLDRLRNMLVPANYLSTQSGGPAIQDGMGKPDINMPIIAICSKELTTTRPETIFHIKQTC